MSCSNVNRPVLPPGTAKTPTHSPRRSLLLALFFCTGSASLLCEISWIRISSLYLGATLPAVGTVFAVFFAGIALGSAASGRIAFLSRRPVRLFAHTQFATAVAVTASIPLFTLLGPFGARPPSEAGLLSQLPFALLATIPPLAIPTILMGASLPILSKAFIHKEIGRNIGLLLSVNCLGGALATALSGLFLMQRLGSRNSLLLAAAIYLLTGLISSLVKSGTHPSEDPHPSNLCPPFGNTPIPSTALRRIMPPTVLAAGLLAIGNEVLWIRFFALIVPNTVFTYSFTLTAVLLGLSLGSLLASTISDHTPFRATFTAWAVAGTSLFMWLTFHLPAHWWHDHFPSPDTPLQQFVTLLLGLAVPSTLAGAVFPLALRLIQHQPHLSPLSIGRLQALHTLGGILGSLAFSFLLLPTLGLANSAALSTLSAILVACTLWIADAPNHPHAITATSIIATIALFLLPALSSKTKLPADFLGPAHELIAFEEGLTANVAVLHRNNTHVMEIDRWWQGESHKNHQIMAAHLPMILHPQAKSVLGVGLGTGQTFSRFLMYPIESLECIEIEPAVLNVATQWFPSNWIQDPRTRVLLADGRHYLASTSRTFDMISVEVGQGFRPGVASFYTQEFYRISKERLNPDGLLIQFLPVRLIPPHTIKSLVATLLTVFPHAQLWYNTGECLLIGYNNPPSPHTFTALSKAIALPTATADLQYAYWGGPKQWLNLPENLAAGFLCGPSQLAALSADGFIVHDDPPALDYLLARFTTGIDPKPSVDLLRNHLSPISDFLLDPPSEQSMTALRNRNLDDILAHDHLQQAVAAADRGDFITSASALDHAYKSNPENRFVLRFKARFLDANRSPQAAIPTYREAIELTPEDASLWNDLGSCYQRSAHPQDAQRAFEHAIRLNPALPEPHQNLGTLFLKQGLPEQAISEFQTAIQLAPNNPKTYNNLGIALAQIDDIDSAVQQFKTALALDPTYSAAKSNLNALLHNP